MRKHIYLSIFLGLLFNTMFFAQTEVEVETEVTTNGQTEITIERTVIDEDGNETKYVITKIGDEAENVMSNEMIIEHIGHDFKIDIHEDGPNIEKRVIIIEDIDGPEHRFMRGLAPMHEKHNNPKVRMGVELTNEKDGVKINYVSGNSAAQEGGLNPGDIITHLDNQPIKTHEELASFLMSKEVGDELLVTYLREESEESTTLTLKENISKNHFRSKTSCDHLEKPCLGVLYNSWNDAITFTEIYKESGAEVSGLQAGDKLLKVNDQAYKFSRGFDRVIKEQKPGSMITIEYERDGEVLTTEAEVGVWDECGVCQLLSEQRDENDNVAALQPLSELALSSFEMYPIPAQDEVTVSFVAERAPVEVMLYDVNGKVIDKEIISDFSGSFTKTYDVSNVAPGMALITISQNGQSTTKQALIQ